MGFNFNQFFGYESGINQHPEQVLMYGFAAIIFGVLGLTFVAFILRKIKLIAVIDHLIAPLIISLLVCLVVAILPTLILYLLASNISGVKLIYCWITIFTGITFFCFSNYQTIKNWANHWTRK
ncbi:hypothetical protein [Pedobacter antarcticus]|uniref:hypothetical protein n=1 Tax=Pedobacter antarcticus TaxID=34086 RepID=UPI00088CDC1F|nr:hypothetical protein [Pedobacter antarcticus]SDL54676.1 hypothetical protein SAMN04488084_101631 [Pedobacter antarcticus]